MAKSLLHWGATLWGRLYRQERRKAQPTERFYESVRPSSQVLRQYTIIHLWWLRDNLQQELASSVTRGFTGSSGRPELIHIPTGDSITITLAFNCCLFKLYCNFNLTTHNIWKTQHAKAYTQHRTRAQYAVMLTMTWDPRPRTEVTRSWSRPSSIKAKTRVPRPRPRKKTKANNDHKLYMHSEHLANSNDWLKIVILTDNPLLKRVLSSTTNLPVRLTRTWNRRPRTTIKAKVLDHMAKDSRYQGQRISTTAGPSGGSGTTNEPTYQIWAKTSLPIWAKLIHISC